jgi:hypothetical protein
VLPVCDPFAAQLVYRGAMRRLFSFCLVLLSLVALITPSLAAISLGPMVISGADTVVVTLDTGAAPAFKPCQLQGGKRVLPCNPDRAVLSGVVLAPPATPALPRTPLEQQRPPSLAPAVDPPPPRRL